MYNNNNQYNDNQYGYQQGNYQQGNYQQANYQQMDYEQAKYDQNYGDQVDYILLCDQTLDARTGFVKKVYALLSFELALTLGMVALALYTDMGFWFVNVDYINIYAYGHNYQFTEIYVTGYFWSTLFIAFFFHIALFCCHGIARKVPINFIFTLGYTFFMSQWLGGISLLFAMVYGSVIIWEAWGITFGLVFSITIYAMISKTDLSMKGGFIFVLIPVIFMCMFCSIFASDSGQYVWAIIITSLVLILYGFFLLWETALIMGKGKIKLSIDDYILASLILYGTIIQMFLRILEILALARGGK